MKNRLAFVFACLFFVVAGCNGDDKALNNNPYPDGDQVDLERDEEVAQCSGGWYEYQESIAFCDFYNRNDVKQRVCFRTVPDTFDCDKMMPAPARGMAPYNSCWIVCYDDQGNNIHSDNCAGNSPSPWVNGEACTRTEGDKTVYGCYWSAGCQEPVDGDVDVVEEIAEAEPEAETAEEIAEELMEVDTETSDGEESADEADGEPPVCSHDADCNDNNPCTEDRCMKEFETDAVRCVNTPLTSTSIDMAKGGSGKPPCDDGDACTRWDICENGLCVGTMPIVCEALDQCHEAGVCDSATGECSSPIKINGTECNDDSICTQTDTCQNGSCVGGNPLNCDDGNVCTNDRCGAYGCSYTYNTNICDDGDACTANDVCGNGACHGTTIVCDDGNECTKDSCDSVSGCRYDNDDGAVCDDQSACTANDTCFAGACSGTTVSCDDGNECTDETCDPLLGCQRVYNADACDDGNACTAGDVCHNGQCAGQDISCDDGNECTDDFCVTLTGCRNEPRTGATCNDGKFCTVGETCSEIGVCGAGHGRDCSAVEDQCNGSLCDENNDICVKDHRPKENTQCNADSNGCTVNDLCHNGTCVPGTAPDCSGQSDQCNTGVCHSESVNSYVCLKDPSPMEGGICDDGLYCTVGDVCQAGVCGGGIPRDCSVFTDQCNTGVCNEFDDMCEPKPLPNDTVCNDRDACTRIDTCQSGVCSGSDRVTCEALDQCHIAGTCDRETGICSDPTRPNGAPCDDSDLCTSADSCQSGMCRGATVSCDDGNECTKEICDPSYGCGSIPITDPCDDHNACTANDVCGNGACHGTAVVCDDGNSCTEDICDPNAGCRYNPSTGGVCDDHNACTTADTCANGSCAGAVVNCDDGNICTNDSCAPALGCQHTNNTNACNDHNACTTNDVCGSGVCDGAPVDCNDHNACTVDSCAPASGCTYQYVGDSFCDDGNVCTADRCDPRTGGCEYINNSDGCSDDNACTVDDICSGGVCHSGSVMDCDDGNPGTYDTCDSVGQCVHEPVPSDGDTDIDDNSEAEVDDIDQAEDSDPDANDVESDAEEDVIDYVDESVDTDTSDNDTSDDYESGTSCTADSQCDDNNVCTNDACSNSICTNVALPYGTPVFNGGVQIGACEYGQMRALCITNSDCDDGDSMTDDYCHAGECRHIVHGECWGLFVRIFSYNTSDPIQVTSLTFYPATGPAPSDWVWPVTTSGLDRSSPDGGCSVTVGGLGFDGVNCPSDLSFGEGGVYNPATNSIDWMPATRLPNGGCGWSHLRSDAP